MNKTAVAAALALSLGASLAHAQTRDPRGCTPASMLAWAAQGERALRR